MAMLIWLHILFFVMLTPAQSWSNKFLKEKDAGTYASNKLGFGLGWSLGGLPFFRIGLGGEGTGNPGPTSDGFAFASPGFSFGGENGGSINSGFNIGAGFDFGGGIDGYGGGGTATGGGSSSGDHGGSTMPNSCHCDCDKAGGTSGKSTGKNEKNPPAPAQGSQSNGAFSHIAPQHY